VSLDVEPIVEALAAARRDTTATKTSTMTFAVFHEDAQIANWVEERTRALADKHPSRVVIFDGLHDDRDQRIAPSERRGEWIEVGARGASPAELASALAMLELPSVPVVLLWAAGALVRDERFLSLAQLANATICSSSLVQTNGEGLRDLTAFVEQHPEITLQDVAYLRLSSWQELIAEFFDEPEHRRALSELRSVEVGAGSDAEMYYVLGWLASRLAWTPQAPGRFSSPHGPVEFTMCREGPPRRLSRIELRTGAARYAAAVLPDDDATICLQVEGAGRSVKRCAPLHSVDLASLVERAILQRTRDDVFIESMAMARHILERQAA
jgi:glucose-6-phosphate dehydrogenase assembly protein OpcA